MKGFQVITDSTSDIEKKFRDEYDIDYFKMKFTIDGVEHDADLDWSEVSPKEYYTMMREGKIAKTSTPLRDEFITKFTKYLDMGLDILYVACSTKLSGSRNIGEQISLELLEKYPDRKIVCLDSLRSNYSEGLIAMKASELSRQGMNVTDAANYLESILLKYQVHAIVGSLEWLKKAGRVKASTAFFGNIIQIKPIICSDAKGNNFAYEKVVGRKKSIDRLIDIVSERCEDPSNSIICVEHADSEADANYVIDKLKERLNPKAINLSNVGPIIGATTGPDTITISFFGKEVDFYDGQEK